VPAHSAALTLPSLSRSVSYKRLNPLLMRICFSPPCFNCVVHSFLENPKKAKPDFVWQEARNLIFEPDLHCRRPTKFFAPALHAHDSTKVLENGCCSRACKVRQAALNRLFNWIDQSFSESSEGKNSTQRFLRTSSSLKPSIAQNAGLTNRSCPSKFSTAIPTGLALKTSRKSWTSIAISRVREYGHSLTSFLSYQTHNIRYFWRGHHLLRKLSKTNQLPDNGCFRLGSARDSRVKMSFADAVS